MTTHFLRLTILVTLLGQLRAETLAPLDGKPAPQTHQQLWADYDPRAEPLDTEVLHEWEEDEVVLRVVRYRVGVFKGEKAMMAAVYGFPKGGKSLPGLLNIHGGGQYADYKAVLTNAKRGYATITIAWAGRISAPDYRVGPKEVKLFWEGKTDDPNYKVTTDWGALDAYHAPSKNGKDAFVTIRDGSEDWTFDDVESPRNSSWFLCTMGARRALTFLENQAEVDANRLGVYGHSMGGKLTVATAGSDARVKVAAPSCGGISDRYNDNPLHRNTVGDSPALKAIRCPTIFLSPANDFHGHINNLVQATAELGQNDWRVTCSPHLNHRDYPENEVATQLWFDQHLKRSFAWPKTPQTTLNLNTSHGIPTMVVRPDGSRPILGVEIYYTQQGFDDGDRQKRENRMSRFWHYAPSTKNGEVWTAALPVFSTELPLWVYANVIYPLDEPVTAAGYYFGEFTAERFNVSSLIQLIPAAELQAAGVRATLQPSPLIETFQGDWRKAWYRHDRDDWGLRTHKVYHPMWAAPAGAKLALDVLAAEPNKLVIGLDQHAAEVVLSGQGAWQTVTLGAAEFLNAENEPRGNWDGLKELRILAAEHLRAKDRSQKPRLVGAGWKGAPPQFRNLRWVAAATIPLPNSL